MWDIIAFALVVVWLLSAISGHVLLAPLVLALAIWLVQRALDQRAA